MLINSQGGQKTVIKKKAAILIWPLKDKIPILSVIQTELRVSQLRI